MNVTVKLRLIDLELLADCDMLRDEIVDDWVKFLRWCLDPEGGDLSLFDIIDLDEQPVVVDVDSEG